MGTFITFEGEVATSKEVLTILGRIPFLGIGGGIGRWD